MKTDRNLIHPQKLSDIVVDRIEAMILEGALKPGERLPAEREFAKRLGVSRPSLREAIRMLSAKGLVETRRGGGSFVSNMLDPTFTNPLLNLFKSHPESLFDLLEMRSVLEAEAASLAAQRATEEDIEIISRRFDEMIEVHKDGSDAARNAQVDLEFHLSIAEAAHNAILLYIMRGFYNVLLSSIFTALERMFARPDHPVRVREQHDAIYRAIKSRDPDTARMAALRHIEFVEQTAREINHEEERRKRAQRRLYGFAD